MSMFTQEHADLLFNEPWRVMEDASDVAFLFKFQSTEVTQACCFLITDTKRVWVEALEGRHVARRARYHSGTDSLLPLENAYEESRWRRARLTQIAYLHSPNSLEAAELSAVESSPNADLEVVIKSEEDSWKWETTAANAHMAAEILSKHLIIPLITLSDCALKSSSALSDMSDATWTKSLDMAAKTSRVTNPARVFFRKARPSSSIRRISQISDRVNIPAPLLSTFPDETEPPPLPSPGNYRSYGQGPDTQLELSSPAGPSRISNFQPRKLPPRRAGSVISIDGRASLPPPSSPNPPPRRVLPQRRPKSTPPSSPIPAPLEAHVNKGKDKAKANDISDDATQSESDVPPSRAIPSKTPPAISSANIQDGDTDDTGFSPPPKPRMPPTKKRPANDSDSDSDGAKKQKDASAPKAAASTKKGFQQRKPIKRRNVF